MKFGNIAVLALGTSFIAAGALASNLMVAPRAIAPVDTNSLSERVAQLETKTAALQSQVAAQASDISTLKTQLAATTKSAGEANFKAGLATIWINANGDGAVKASTWVNTNGGQVMQVVTAYPKHTHGYQQRDLGWNNVPCSGGQGGYCSYVFKWTQTPGTTTAPQ